jgi:hypothetical protein
MLDGAVLGVPGDVPWSEVPPEAGPPHQIKGGLVFHYLGGGHHGL